jgi:hypothetical protein
MIEEALSVLSGVVEEQEKKFLGVVTGTVEDLLDPMGLGRVKVKLPFIDSADSSPWARVAVPMAGLAHGFYFIPEKGDEVLVAFEHGDVKVPYIIGSLWHGLAPPPLPSPLAQTRMIRTPLGNQIVFSEEPPSIVITTPDLTHTVTISAAGIQIVSDTNLINLTPDGVTISGPNLNLVSQGNVNISGSNVTVSGTASASVESAGVCSVKGSLVEIN